MRLAALIFAASLNPLVVRAPDAVGPLPADCRVSGAAAVSRVPVAAPEEALPLPPVRPAGTKGAQQNLEEIRRALAENDRAAFDAALARARAEGGATRPYEDIARVWDAQFESPFFGQDSEAYRIASSYPGWEAAVRRQIFTDDRGVKFYPAAETRAFLAGQAGVKRREPAVRRADVRPPASRTSATRGRSPVRSSRPRVARKSTPTAVAAARPAEMAPATARTNTTTATATPATPATTPPPPAAPVGTAPATSPATVPTDTAATSTAPAPPPPAATTAPAVAEPAAPSTATAAVPAQPARRSLILPAILILIGLGVLTLLFRTAR